MKQYTQLIPAGANRLLLAYINPDDLRTYEEGSEDFLCVHLDTGEGLVWLGYANKNTYCPMQYALDYRWHLVLGDISEDKRDAIRNLITETQHRAIVRWQRKQYQRIVKKLEADLKHNVFRAHFLGYYHGYDLIAVLRDVEQWLAHVTAFGGNYR